MCVLQQRPGISTGLASSVSSSRTATLTRSRKATQTRTVRFGVRGRGAHLFGGAELKRVVRAPM